MSTESLDRLFLYIISLFTIFLPLLCTVIASALLLLENVSKNKLKKPRQWHYILNTLFALILAMVGGLFGSSVVCFSQYKDFSLASVCGVVFLEAVAGLIFFLTLVIWMYIRGEFLTRLDEMGT